jgi:hypothetical protein
MALTKSRSRMTAGAPVNVLDFGAVGDGVADDTAAVSLAMNAATGGVLDGSGRTYKLTANIAPTCQNIVIQNATFDISPITSGGSAINFAGTQGSAVPLTADILTGSNSIAVGSTTGFAADEYAWLTSSTVFAVTTSAVLGQMVKIKSVDSGTAMTLYDDVLYDFTTAASASIALLTPKQNITLRNVNFVGAGTGIQTAVDFDKCVDVLVDDCSFDYVDYASILFDRCVNATVTNTSMRYARAVGLSYGIVIANGCYSVKIANCYGEDQRHMVTVGDNDGVNLFISVTNCHAAAQRDAGLDSHPAGDFMLFDGNTIEMIGGSADGIICQSPNFVATNNTIVGNSERGIRHQILTEISTGSSLISGNSIRNVGGNAGTDTGIVVQNNGTGTTLDGVVISNNVFYGAMEYGIYVYADTGNIKNVTISGNTLTSDASSHACYFRADAGYTFEDFAITGNVFKCSGVSNIYLLGLTTGDVLNGTISGNTIKGGDNGIRLIRAQNVVETGNYNTGTVRKVYVDAVSTNLIIDRRASSVVTYSSSTVYTVKDQDEYLIINRAATVTVTLPVAATWPGRGLSIKTIQAQSVISASSNVYPITSATAGTAILPATDGAWALLKSDGTQWVIMQEG